MTFSYNKSIILNDLSFEINEGEFVGLLGKNGAGKSTLFHCILNFIKNYNGEVTIDNINTKTMSRKTMARHISFISQKHESTFNYSVIDTVMMGAANRMGMFEKPSEKHYMESLNALKQLKIDNLSDKLFNNLSGGEQQLVMIARALAQNTKMIIMDEPTSALDFYNQEFVMSKIRDISIKNNISFLISSHNPNLVLKYCKKIIALSNHKILSFGETNAILDEDLLYNLYNMKTKIYKTEHGDFIQAII